MGLGQSVIAQRFNITERDLESYLAEAMSSGGEYADLYFEYLSNTSITVDEGIVKSASESVSLGVGVRVLAGSALDTRIAMISRPRRFARRLGLRR